MSNKSNNKVLLIDTCVWINLAQDTSSKPLVMAIKNLIENNLIKLIVPTIIKDEFERNKDRIIDISKKKLSQDIRKVKNIIEQYSNSGDKDTVINGLDDVNHKLPMMADTISEQSDTIWDILSTAETIAIPDNVKIQASDRALLKKAPFHKSKNSMADALIIELFFNATLTDEQSDFYFITHNPKDFSSESDNRIHHEDYNEYFSKDKITYSTNLPFIINEIAPDILDETTFEYDWDDESRGLYEILDTIDMLTDKIWYNRHCGRAYDVENGNILIVDGDDYDVYNHQHIRKDIWEGALKSAKNKEEKYPNELGPWSDFEWGMLSGKLSALRWVIGEEWDMLDT